MKRLILILLTVWTGSAIAQNDGYADKFCELTAYQKALSAKVTIEVDSGQITKALSDSRVKGPDGKPREFYGVVNAINYLSLQGWQFINAFPMIEGNSYAYHFYFKKRVPIAEIPKPVTD